VAYFSGYATCFIPVSEARTIASMEGIAIAKLIMLAIAYPFRRGR